MQRRGKVSLRERVWGGEAGVESLMALVRKREGTEGDCGGGRDTEEATALLPAPLPARQRMPGSPHLGRSARPALVRLSPLLCRLVPSHAQLGAML